MRRNRSINIAKTLTYTYDTLYRLTSASTTLASSTPYKETYAYNAIGNITSKSNVGNYTYAGNTGSSYANPHAATTINGVTYTYDLNGNLASTSASQTNTWDYRNRLTTATKSGTNTTYLYDINEQRVQKTVGGKTTRYPSLYFETTNASTTKHVYANGTLVSTVDGTGSASTTVYHNHQDHLGSTAAVTNAIGYLSRLYNYYPYGAIRLDEGSGAFTQLNQYIGQDYDSESQLSYLNARYYDGARGQFISQDPMFWSTSQNLMDPQTLNSYSYASNNPINKKDPTGLATVKGSMKEIQKGLIKLLTDYRDFLVSASTNPKGTAKAMGQGAVNAGKAGVAAAKDPKGTASAVYRGGSSVYNTFRYGSDAQQDALIGRGVVFGLDMLAGKGAGKLKYLNAPGGGVIDETLGGRGNITSASRLSSSDALTTGEQFLGPNYTQLGKPDSGVFRSADGLRQFRIDNGSITHQTPHVSFEAYRVGQTTQPYVNNHVELID